MTVNRYIKFVNQGLHQLGVEDSCALCGDFSNLVNQISIKTGLVFIHEADARGEVCFLNSPDLREEFRTSFLMVDALDYCYALLFSSGYRRSLKLDFQSMPLPESGMYFWRLVKMGNRLRQIHSMETHLQIDFPNRYPIAGNNLVDKGWVEKSMEGLPHHHGHPNPLPHTIDRVYINENQYFEHIPQESWELQIGSCWPAQKWLINHSNQILSPDQVLQYLEIIAALFETAYILKEIDRKG